MINAPRLGYAKGSYGRRTGYLVTGDGLPIGDRPLTTLTGTVGAAAPALLLGHAADCCQLCRGWMVRLVGTRCDRAIGQGPVARRRRQLDDRWLVRTPIKIAN